MLNASPEGEEQQKALLTWKAPIRNRTPWDAGGYSLPVNHDLDTTINNNIHHNDSLVESTHIYSTKHGPSDSRGSLSSFASASTSTHSRFSSASTVNGFHAFGAITENIKYPDSQEDWANLITTSAALSPVSPGTFSFYNYPISPRAEPLNALFHISERQHFDTDTSSKGNFRDCVMADIRDTTEAYVASDLSVLISRTASPTDALLIKRPESPRLKELDKSTGAVFTQPFMTPTTYLDPHVQQTELQLDRHRVFPFQRRCNELDSHSTRFAMENRRPKRSYSAPDIQAPMRISVGEERGEIVTRCPRSEPTPPLSHYRDNESPQVEVLEARLDIEPEHTPLQDQQPICMFKDGCDTGSQPRKAVSHIFGRNKMCTRLIPEHVWVRYCRKHYQRSRYREPKNWPRCQCDLVQKQIQRLEEWSAENERRGEGGIVRSWGLALRKREQKRLDDLALLRAGDGSHVSGCGEGEASGPPAPATAVPVWLRDLCGHTYNTTNIRDIFNRVHRGLLDSANPVFPDIEILPHITLDGEEPESPVRGAKRKTPTAQQRPAQQRRRSMGVALPQSPENFTKNVQKMKPLASNPSYVTERPESPPLHKRQRQNRSTEDVDTGLMAQSQRLRFDISTGLLGHELPPPSMGSESPSVYELSPAHGSADTYRTPIATSVAPNTPQRPSSGIGRSTASTMPSRYPLRSNILHARVGSHRRSRPGLNTFPYPDVSKLSHVRAHSPARQYAQNMPGQSAAPRYLPPYPLDEGAFTTAPSQSGMGRHVDGVTLPRLSVPEPRETRDEYHDRR